MTSLSAPAPAPAPAPAVSSPTEIVKARKVGISRCLTWLQGIGGDPATSAGWIQQLLATCQFEPDRTEPSDPKGDDAACADGIGVYTQRELQCGDTIMSIPMAAGMTLAHPHFRCASGGAIPHFVKDCEVKLLELITSQASTVSPHDRYAKLQGRVLLKNYLLLAFVLTLVLLHKDEIEHEHDKDKSSSVGAEEKNDDTDDGLQQGIRTVYTYWSSFLETLPQNWSHLPMFWNTTDLELLQGTSFHALTVRFQVEMKQVFQHVLVPVVLLAFQQQQQHKYDSEGIDNDTQSSFVSVLETKFYLALAIVNSHAHAKDTAETTSSTATGTISTSTSTTRAFIEPVPIILPIIDLVNGMRDEKDCNAELIGYPLLGCYQLVVTKDGGIPKGTEIILNYGENQLSNLDFFVKFGYMPLTTSTTEGGKPGYPTIVPTDFVTLPIPRSQRPKSSMDDVDVDSASSLSSNKHTTTSKKNSTTSSRSKKTKKGKKGASSAKSQQQGAGGTGSAVSKMDELRWKELSRVGFTPARVVEPVPYFQRPLYLNGNYNTIAKLKTAPSMDVGWSIPQMRILEQYVMTMLASKQALTKLSQGKQPPAPILQWYEPGKRIICILDAYLLDHTKDEVSTSTASTGNNNKLLALQARYVERQIVLLWRDAIATNHGLYGDSKKSGIEPWENDGDRPSLSLPKKETAVSATATATTNSSPKTSVSYQMEQYELHKKAFDTIITKYQLNSEKKSTEISELLTHGTNKTSAQEFASKFGMDVQEAVVFLEWIKVGIQFKEKTAKNAAEAANIIPLK